MFFSKLIKTFFDKIFIPSRIIFLMLLISNGVYCQTQEDDVIYLKNGGLIRGKIILFMPDSIVKIETFGRNVFAFQMDEVEKIIKEKRVMDFKYKYPITYKYSGFVNVTEFGFLGGDGIGFHVRTINSYQDNPHLSAGLGIGIDIYQFNDEVFVPVFLDVRGDLRKNTRVTPYYFFDVGYAFTWLIDKSDNVEYEGGIMFNPGIGLKIHSADNSATVFNIGYNFQKAKTIRDWWGGIIETEIQYNRISFRVGVTFW